MAFTIVDLTRYQSTLFRRFGQDEESNESDSGDAVKFSESEIEDSQNLKVYPSQMSVFLILMLIEK